MRMWRVSSSSIIMAELFYLIFLMGSILGSVIRAIKDITYLALVKRIA